MKYSNKTVLSKFDLQSMEQLLNNGFSLQESLILIENKKNSVVLNHIKDKLQQGIPISSFFYECIPKKYGKVMKGFLSYISFTNSLSLTLKIVDKTDEQLNKTKEKILYPLLLLLGTICGLYFFDIVCLPVIIELCKSFNTDTNFILLEIFINFIKIIILLLICIVIICLIISKKDEYKLIVFKHLQKHHKQSIIVKLITLRFMNYYLECIKVGISTKNIVEILENLKNEVIINDLARQLNNFLNQGNEFIKAIKETTFDNELLRFMQIAIYAKDKEKILKSYINYVEIYLNNKLKNNYQSY